MVISKILTSLGCLLILSLQLIAAAPIEALKPIAFDPTDSGNPHIDPLPFEIQAKKRGGKHPSGTGSGGIYNKDWPYSRIVD
ncbi:hypothetical protein CPC16_005061 [Podila verticillata]|nr:hypothetical protein CPC16_005061 [Podila verticillata]KFH69412.1 hypothetical protein MVEG_04224 [Podila verticillata NRRL 6337]